VLYVADHRTEHTLVPYFERLTSDERAGIRAIALDMLDP